MRTNKIFDKCNEISNHLDKNQTSDKKNLNISSKSWEVCSHTIAKLQSAQGRPGEVPGSVPGWGDSPLGGAFSGPTIKKVD